MWDLIVLVPDYCVSFGFEDKSSTWSSLVLSSLKYFTEPAIAAMHGLHSLVRFGD